MSGGLGSRTTTPRLTVDEAHKRFGTSNDAELVLALLGACVRAEEAVRLAKRVLAGEELSDAESLALMEALAGVDKPAYGPDPDDIRDTDGH